MIGEQRKLKYRVNWREAREAILSERFKGPKLRFDPDITTKAASDFSKRVKEGEYEYGRKTAEIFSGFLDPSSEALEIGPGPGTVTVPLAKRVKKITAVDLSLRNIAHLEENLREESCENVDVIHTNWMRTDDEALKGRYDLVFCSHFLWMIPDLEEHLKKMETPPGDTVPSCSPPEEAMSSRKSIPGLPAGNTAGNSNPTATILPTSSSGSGAGCSMSRISHSPIR
ncbi:Ribosomal RNA small subunit methyltransferase A [anaerobic digester metagenome]